MSAKVRFELDAALDRRKVSYVRLGSWRRSISIPQYINQHRLPVLKPNPLEFLPFVLEKQIAIRASKFHLAIDHKVLNGYISEKVWHALRVGTVPIYFGAPEARFFLPPRSTIYVEDFETYDDLIHYIEYLDSNDTAYNEYLQWKQDIRKANSAYALFLQGYGQSVNFNNHFCLWELLGPTVLEYLASGKPVPPFRRKWVDWKTGQVCEIPPGACNGRDNIFSPPTSLLCPLEHINLLRSSHEIGSLYGRLRGE